MSYLLHCVLLSYELEWNLRNNLSLEAEIPDIRVKCYGEHSAKCSKETSTSVVEVSFIDLSTVRYSPCN